MGKKIHPLDRNILLLSIFFGLIVWTFDAILDWLIFYRPEPFLDLLLLDIASHEFYVRSLILVTFIIFGIIISIIFNQLHSERANFRSILNSMQDGAYVTNKNYDIEFINSVLIDEFGPVEGKKCYNYFHDRIEPCPWCRNKEVFTGNTVRWEWTSPKNHKTYDLIDTPLYNSDGSISKLEIFRDITELKNSINSYQALFETSPVGIGLSDEFGNVITCNDSMLEITGYTIEELQDVKIQSTYVTAEVREKLLRVLKDEGKVRNYEVKLRRKTGEIFDASLSIEVIELASQKLFQTIVLDITEQKRMQEALQQEKDIAQKYLDIAGVMFVVLDKNQKITLINKKGCDLLGYEEKDIIGKNWFDNCLPLRFRKEVRAVYDQLMAGEIELVEYYENPVLTRNDEERIIAWHNSILYNENNTIIGILSSGEDITELKQTEHQLQADKTRLELALRGAGQGIWEWNLKSGDISIDVYWEEVLGYSHGEQNFDIERWRQLFHPDFISKYELALNDYLEGQKEYFELEYQMMTKAGEYIWVWSQGKCVEYDDKKQPLRFIGTHKDITELKQMRDNLLESEEKYRNLSERAQDGIMLIQDKSLVYVNPSLGQMLDYTVEEMLNTPFTKYIHPDSLPAVNDRYERRMAGQKFKHIYETEFLTKDGKSLNFEINASLISFQSKPANLVIVRDITERKQVEAERLELEQRRMHFNTMTTHELRTPLTVFRGYVEFLQRVGEDLSQEKKKNVLQELHKSCDRLESLISNAGDFTKIERNIFQIFPKVMNLDIYLQEFVESSKELLKDQFIFNNHDIETSIQIMGDSDRLKQISGNLLENAINHTSGLTRRIVLSTEILSDKIRIILSDNGAGIAKENLEKIFEQFITIPTDFYVGGTGVGLYISRKIAEAHQGTLKAESEGLGKGARFILELPR